MVQTVFSMWVTVAMAQKLSTYDGSKAAKVESSAKDALPPYSIAF